MSLSETVSPLSGTKSDRVSLKRRPWFRDSASKAIYVVALLLAMTGWIWLLFQGAQWLYAL